jgi:hypothetical protein
MEKYNFYNNIDKDIWNISLIFNHEEYGMLLGLNKNNKFEIPSEIVKNDDNSLIEVLSRCFLKKMISYDNIIVQQWLMTDFRSYYNELYSIEPNKFNYDEWYKENMDYLENKNTKMNYDLKFTDIIKNKFENWFFENKIMVYDVPLIKNNEKIKNRIYIINIEDMDLMTQELIMNYSYYYEHFVHNNKKKEYKNMIMTKLMNIPEQDCMKNLQNAFDYMYMGVLI